MKRRTLTTIEFVADDLPFESPSGMKGNIMGLKIMSDGIDHTARLFLNDMGGDLDSTWEPADWVQHKLETQVVIATSARVEKQKTSFVITFDLIRGKGFCETALDVGLAILRSLNITEETAKDYLCGLGIQQETQVKFRNQWMSYTQYLLLTSQVLSHRAHSTS